MDKYTSWVVVVTQSEAWTDRIAPLSEMGEAVVLRIAPLSEVGEAVILTDGSVQSLAFRWGEGS